MEIRNIVFCVKVCRYFKKCVALKKDDFDCLNICTLDQCQHNCTLRHFIHKVLSIRKYKLGANGYPQFYRAILA